VIPSQLQQQHLEVLFTHSVSGAVGSSA
jgi:hypothetical protein